MSIMAYTAKYASAFYGPFRDALASAPAAGSDLGFELFNSCEFGQVNTRIDHKPGFHTHLSYFWAQTAPKIRNKKLVGMLNHAS